MTEYSYIYTTAEYLNGVNQNIKVKLGKSINIKARKATLQTANCEQGIMLGISPEIKEAYLHKKYAEYRTRGEWFEIPISLFIELLSQMEPYKEDLVDNIKKSSIDKNYDYFTQRKDLYIKNCLKILKSSLTCYYLMKHIIQNKHNGCNTKNILIDEIDAKTYILEREIINAILEPVFTSKNLINKTDPNAELLIIKNEIYAILSCN